MTTTTETEVLIVGAGFNGLYQLHRLRQQGWSVRLVEAASDLGGVWQNNRYPGARVDSHVPNYEFSMEEVWRDWTWTERFPGRDELVAYFHHLDNVLNLRPDIDFDTRATAALFDASQNKWHIEATGSKTYVASYLVLCTGFGSKPFVPDLPGIDTFEGDVHHTARWPKGGLSFDARHVGVIGTGASGVQIVQEAAPTAASLTVFQRSPVTALPMEQRQLSSADQEAAKADYPAMFKRRNTPPGSFSDIHRRDVGALHVSAAERDQVFEEAWAKGGFHFWVGTFNDILTNEDANRAAYDFWRDKTRERINDSAIAEVLAPSEPPYPFGTKRPSLEQTYYDCFNQPNVGVVDLKANPIVSITPTDISTEGGLHDLDLIVLATGFDANTGGLTAINIRGLDDRSLADTWSNGVDTHVGVAVPGFPNMLILYGPQSSAAFCNGPVCAELQGEWLVDLLEHVRSNGIGRIDSLAEASTTWTDHLEDLADGTLFGKADSWYMGANVPGKKRQLLNYPNSDAYIQRLNDCAKAGYDGFVFS